MSPETGGLCRHTHCCSLGNTQQDDRAAASVHVSSCTVNRLFRDEASQMSRLLTKGQLAKQDGPPSILTPNPAPRKKKPLDQGGQTCSGITKPAALTLSGVNTSAGRAAEFISADGGFRRANPQTVPCRSCCVALLVHLIHTEEAVAHVCRRCSTSLRLTLARTLG